VYQVKGQIDCDLLYDKIESSFICRSRQVVAGGKQEDICFTATCIFTCFVIRPRWQRQSRVRHQWRWRLRAALRFMRRWKLEVGDSHPEATCYRLFHHTNDCLINHTGLAIM